MAWPGGGRSAVGLTASAGAEFLAGPDRDLHRAALETELLAEFALHEPLVAGVERAGGEEHEPRRAGAGLGGAVDPWRAPKRQGRASPGGFTTLLRTTFDEHVLGSDGRPVYHRTTQTVRALVDDMIAKTRAMKVPVEGLPVVAA